MFNPLPPARLAGVLSTVLRESERWSRPLEPFQSGQLKSASSIGRYLSAELANAGAVLAEFRDRVGAILDDALAANPTAPAEWTEALTECRRAVAAAADGPALGECLCVVLAHARRDGGVDRSAAPALAGALHTALRDLVDAEVEILVGASGT